MKRLQWYRILGWAWDWLLVPPNLRRRTRGLNRSSNNVCGLRGGRAA